MPHCVFSVDVEDWFHILDLADGPSTSDWDGLPSHVERNFLQLLDVFDEQGAKVTCFFLGWVAQKFPNLVREAAGRGHEIASHGYGHELVYRQTPSQFLEDVRRAKGVLEDTLGREIFGYRSPGFSCTSETPWFFEKLEEASYRYDSSIFPARRGHGGIEDASQFPHVIAGHRLVEFPISVAPVVGRNVCFFGGGYLRLFPYFLIRVMARRVLKENRPVIFYVHPREIDPTHPRLQMPAVRRFKSYVNLHTTAPKVRSIFRDFPMTTFINLIQNDAELKKVLS